MNKGIAIWNYAYQATDEENVRYFYQRGFDAVSWLGSAFDALDEARGDALANLITETGMRFTIHHKLPDPANAEECARFPGAMRAIANWQKRHGLLAGLTFDFWYPHDMILNYLNTALCEVRGLGVFVACEDTPLHARTLTKFEKYLSQDDDFGILIDLGHMNIRQNMMELNEADEYLRMFRALPVPLKEIHVSDNRGRKDEHRDIGYGILPVSSISSALKDIGFDGIVTTEIISHEGWDLNSHRTRAEMTSKAIMDALAWRK